MPLFSGAAILVFDCSMRCEANTICGYSTLCVDFPTAFESVKPIEDSGVENWLGQSAPSTDARSILPLVILVRDPWSGDENGSKANNGNRLQVCLLMSCHVFR